MGREKSVDKFYLENTVLECAELCFHCHIKEEIKDAFDNMFLMKKTKNIFLLMKLVWKLA